MTAKETYSFEPVSTAIPSAPVAEAVPDVVPETEEDERPTDTAIMVGCGTLGMLVGGPFLALLTALGGRWAADKKSPIGESTRAIGRVTASAGKRAREEHLWCKIKAAVGSLFKKSNTCDCEVCKNGASVNN
jgi:hypothetical protein